MISEDEVKKLAQLARLAVEPDFVPVVTGHLNTILDYVRRLNEIDTSGVEAMSHVQGVSNVFREDTCVPPGSNPKAAPLADPTIPVQESLRQEDMVRNAPDHAGNFIKVPLIVE